MISFVIPTRNRPEALSRTLSAIDRCCAGVIADAEVIVIDNASDAPAVAPGASMKHVRLRTVRSESNLGASARNVGAELAEHDWLVMLDDDSYPLDASVVHALRDAPVDVAAFGAEIVLPDGSRERGGLPEVIIGCGAAIRRSAFLKVGGYDATFDYYAEEYDLCAKFLLNGLRIVHDCRFRVRHEKLTSGRDFNRIVHRLVRNNAWVAQRYAPDCERERELGEVTSRYAAIAVKEQAADGFSSGMNELLCTVHRQPRTPMPECLWDRFTGLSHVRNSLADHCDRLGASVAIVDAGKNDWTVRRALKQLGVKTVQDERDAHVLVIGTLSLGPMLDAFDRRAGSAKPVLCAWQPEHRAGNMACAA